MSVPTRVAWGGPGRGEVHPGGDVEVQVFADEDGEPVLVIGPVEQAPRKATLLINLSVVMEAISEFYGVEAE